MGELVPRTGLDEETVKVELIHLLGTHRARRLEQDAGEELVYELLIAIVKKPHLKLFLSPAERESTEPRRWAEGEGGGRARQVSLQPVPPGRDLPEAMRWLGDADEALARARRSEQEHDPTPSVANSVKAIEFAAKALLYLGGS